MIVDTATLDRIFEAAGLTDYRWRYGFLMVE
jgi:hypothetical protein